MIFLVSQECKVILLKKITLLTQLTDNSSRLCLYIKFTANSSLVPTTEYLHLSHSGVIDRAMLIRLKTNLDANRFYSYY